MLVDARLGLINELPSWKDALDAATEPPTTTALLRTEAYANPRQVVASFMSEPPEDPESIGRAFNVTWYGLEECVNAFGAQSASAAESQVIAARILRVRGEDCPAMLHKYEEQIQHTLASDPCPCFDL